MLMNFESDTIHLLYVMCFVYMYGHKTANRFSVDHRGYEHGRVLLAINSIYVEGVAMPIHGR